MSNIDDTNITMNFDLQLLRCFEALMAERSVSRAAVKLNLSQPAMSHALGRLRALFDDPLLARGHGGMTPTSRALGLEPQVREALSAAYRLVEKRTLFRPEESRLEFTVMTAEYIEYLLLPRLIARLNEEAPFVRVTFRSAQPDRALEWLERGELDFRLGWWPESAPALRAKRLLRDPLVCVARLGHPLLAGTITEEQFMSIPHVVQSERMKSARRAIEQAVLSRHRQLQTQFKVQDALALCNVVTHSDLIGTLPERFARALASKFPLQVMPIPMAITEIRQAMYWHERTHNEPSHQWFRQLISDLTKGL
jgi:DNA-binding transcriptional LysR family regulator